MHRFYAKVTVYMNFILQKKTVKNVNVKNVNVKNQERRGLNNNLQVSEKVR